MKQNGIDLITYNKSEKLQFEGKCKIMINLLSKLLIIEPFNEDYKMISAMFKWKFVAKKNILFVFAEYNFQDFALVFDEESRCTKIYEILIKKEVEIGTDDLIFNRFFPAICNALAEFHDREFDEIFGDWIKKLNDSEKEKYIQVLKEKNVYDSLFSGEKEFVPSTHMNGDNGHSKNLRKRKAKDMSSLAEDNENNDLVSKKNKYSKYEIIVEKPDYEIIYFKDNGIPRSRLFIFPSSDKTLYYEYYYQNCTKKYQCSYICSRCYKLKKNLKAKVCERRNGPNIVRLNSSEHACELQKYDPSKFTVNQKIIKQPNFKLISYYQRGSPRTALIIFNEINPNLCYEYFYCKKIKGYLCCSCASGSRKRKVQVKAEILKYFRILMELCKTAKKEAYLSNESIQR